MSDTSSLLGARKVALSALRAIRTRHSFVNLLLPGLLSQAQLSARDAAFCTDMVYQTLRWQGFLDALIDALTAKKPAKASTSGAASVVDSTKQASKSASLLDADVRDILRLGLTQLLLLDVAAYAVVTTSVELARHTPHAHRATGLINATLRRASERSRKEWEAILTSRIPRSQHDARLSVRYSHPKWIIRKLRESFAATNPQMSEEERGKQLEEILRADNLPAPLTLCARPGLVAPADLANQITDRAPEAHVEKGLWSPYALRVSGIDPGTLAAVKNAKAGVEDEGSQLVALTLAAAQSQASSDNLWLDLCAAPGGKTALLGALAQLKGATIRANEKNPTRAKLVAHNVAALKDETIDAITVLDGREYAQAKQGQFSRVLVDVPCSGLGALRRRPEARWSKKSEEIDELIGLQKQLLNAAIDATRPGGVILYSTCSPVVEETRAVVDACVNSRDDVQRLDAAQVLSTVVGENSLKLAHGDVQLFNIDTDMMFMSLLRKVVPQSPTE